MICPICHKNITNNCGEDGDYHRIIIQAGEERIYLRVDNDLAYIYKNRTVIYGRINNISYDYSMSLEETYQKLKLLQIFE